MAIVIFSTAAAFAQAQTQTVVYPATPPDHYLQLPPQSSDTSSGAASGNVSSPSQYPTAQGNYLRLPPSYNQPSVSRTVPQAQQALPPSAASYHLPIAQPAVQAVAISSSANPVPVTTAAATPTPVNVRPNTPPVVYYYPQVTNPSPPAVTYYPAATSPSYGYGSYNGGYGAGTGAAPAQAPARYTPAPAAAMPSGQIDLGTGTGISLGAEISSYKYHATGYWNSGEFGKVTGTTYGVTANGTKEFHEGFFRNWFAEGDLRLSYGLHKFSTVGNFEDNLGNAYTIPLESSGFDDYMADMRALFGHDFLLRNLPWDLPEIGVSPYTGIGFRFLLDDGSGSPISFTYNGSSYDYKPYRTYSHYIYLPLGATERIRLTDNSRLSLNNEFDVLIGGWETDDFGDSFSGVPDLKAAENEGIGLRGNLMYEWNSLSFGPFAEYWNINHSAGGNCFYSGDTLYCQFVPHTTTTEFGLQAKYHFSL